MTVQPSPGRGHDPLPLSALAELEEITREYARITDRGAGAWTLLLVGFWIVGAELLFQASPLWGRLAFLTLVPATLALFSFEKRVARPHGEVAYAPTKWERATLRWPKTWIALLALVGEWLALIALYGFVDGITSTEVPGAAIAVMLVVVPAVAAAPAVAPFLTRWGFDVLVMLLAPLTMASTMATRSPGGGHAPFIRLGVLASGCLIALLSPLGLWLRHMQLRVLDQRMAHLREHLR